MKRTGAAALALIASATAAAAQQGALHCGGTEPFWGVTITAQAMWYSDPDTKRRELVLVKPLRAAGRPEDFIRVYQTRRVDGRGNVILVVTRNRQTCSDGMSDRRYPYNAVYVGDGVLEGCCRWTP
ncbi:MAG TPA: hypothetical protein VIF14_00510 [Alphaproteobacteria bacterium]|jgi:uncharacterized membrane protein